MRHRLKQHLAFDQGLANQSDLEEFKIAQPTMEQLGRCARGSTCKIVHFGQPDAQTAPRAVARDPDAVDTAANYEKIIVCLLVHLPVLAAQIVMHPHTGTGK